MEAWNVIAALLLSIASASAQSTVMCTDPLTGLKSPAGQMPSPEPCQRCVCSEEGEVRCSKVECLTPSCSHPVTVSGQCCPVCPTSVCQHPVTASPLPVGPISPVIDPICDKECQCGPDGNVTCSAEGTCAPLVCPDPVKVPGKCCPSCPWELCVDLKTLIRYPAGLVPTHSDDPCQICDCAPFTGITCFTQSCPDLPCDNPQKVTGKCCPVCPETPCLDFRTGNYLPVGPTPARLPCEESCECLPTGEVECDDKREKCPKQDCEIGWQKPGECCSTCEVCTNAKTGTTYPIGPISSDDPCKLCQCTWYAGIICTTTQCRTLDCDDSVDVPGECCKRCPDHVCRHNRTKEWLRVGPVPPITECYENCRCESDGQFLCNVKQCPEPTCQKPFRFPNQCCPVCPDRCPSLESPGVWLPIGPVASSNPCQQNCRCENDGLMRCDSVTCAVKPCSVPLVSIPGRCCPICLLSRLEGNKMLWLQELEESSEDRSKK